MGKTEVNHNDALEKIHSAEATRQQLCFLARRLLRRPIQPKLPDSLPFEMITRPTVLQQKAFSLLGVTL